MEPTDLPNAQDLVRSAIAADLPEDETTRRDWAGVFGLVSFMGLLTILGGMALGLWIGFGKGHPGVGMWIVLASLVWGAAAVSVSRDGREVALQEDAPSETGS